MEVGEKLKLSLTEYPTISAAIARLLELECVGESIRLKDPIGRIRIYEWDLPSISHRYSSNDVVMSGIERTELPLYRVSARKYKLIFTRQA